MSFHTSSALILAATDVTPIAKIYDHEKFFEISMLCFFANLTPQDTQFIISREDKRDFCLWKGIECTDDKHIQKVKMSYRSSGNFLVGFLPHSVEYLSIIFCKQTFVFSARELPLNIHLLDFGNNLITGSLRCEYLPRKLHEVTLQNNKLTGPLFLHDLPPNLAYLRLHFNKIHQSVVYYHELPKTIIIISLYPGGNKISRVLPLFPEDKVAPSLFR